METGDQGCLVTPAHQPDVIREMVDLGLGWTVLPCGRVLDPIAERSPVVVEQNLERDLVHARRIRCATDLAVEALADHPTTSAAASG